MEWHDPQFWAREWARARAQSSLYSGRDRPDRWLEFWNLVATSYARRNEQVAGHHRELVAWLAREGVITGASVVLDVGCGPGTYALPLAERVRQVVALDPAAEMLRVLAEEAARRGLGERIRAVCGRWEDLEASPDYDLVFVANSPAVWDYTTLCKMNQVSRGYCCLVTAARKTRMGLRDELWRRVTGREIRGGAFDPIYPFNILYHEGYYPGIKFIHYAHRHKERPEALFEQYKCYFSIFGYEGPEVERTIRDYLAAVCRDGYCEDEQEGHLAVIWWRARQR